MLIKNLIYEALITDYTAEGQGVAHIEGCAVFVPNAIAGERVRLRIEKAQKTWASGKIVEILEKSQDTVKLYEGCLSFPGHNGAISRARKVKVRAFDRHGNPFEMEAEDMLARCIQHENNHLDGITIMDLATSFYEDEHPEESGEE